MPRDFDVRTMKGDEVEFERAIFESARLVYSFDALAPHFRSCRPLLYQLYIVER